jgi:hypothetical protein
LFCSISNPYTKFVISLECASVIRCEEKDFVQLRCCENQLSMGSNWVRIAGRRLRLLDNLNVYLETHRNDSRRYTFSLLGLSLASSLSIFEICIVLLRVLSVSPSYAVLSRSTSHIKNPA